MGDACDAAVKREARGSEAAASASAENNGKGVLCALLCLMHLRHHACAMLMLEFLGLISL